jgi:sigma-B regulation protein RsbU (phosphoserine phosphatase)
MTTVNRHLLERAADHHFVTLVSGRANRDGRVELCNAGHCQPIVLQKGGSRHLPSTSLPLGVAAESNFPTSSVELEEGDSLILYTDGISEARNSRDEQYGAAGLERVVRADHRASPAQLAAACLAGVRAFQGDAPQSDDLTLMVVRRSQE